MITYIIVAGVAALIGVVAMLAYIVAQFSKGGK